jgi:hypothetical protein
MPRIPGATSVPSSQFRRASPAPAAVDDFAAQNAAAQATVLQAEARAGEAVGQALGQVSDLFLELSDRKVKQEQSAFVSNAYMRFFQETTSDFEQSKTLIDESAEGFTENFMQRTQSRMDLLLENAPPGSEGLFLQTSVGFLERKYEEAVQFESEARKQIAMRNFNDSLDVNQQLLVTNPEKINDILAVTRESIALMEPNLAPEDLTRLLDEKPSTMIETSVQSFIRQENYAAARRSLLIPGLNSNRIDVLANQVRDAELATENRRLAQADRQE